MRTQNKGDGRGGGGGEDMGGKLVNIEGWKKGDSEIKKRKTKRGIERKFEVLKIYFLNQIN